MKPRLPGRLFDRGGECLKRVLVLSPPSPPPSYYQTGFTAFAMSGTQSQIERAIGQIQSSTPHPEIDFTQHQLENGFMISTQERVVKEVRYSTFFLDSVSNLYCL